MAAWEIIVIGFYFFGLLFILFYCLNQLSLALGILRFKKRMKALGKKDERAPLGEFPFVTIQLPVFNEMYVVERLIDAISKMNYPIERYEVQVLDDSTDETLEISRKKVEEYRNKGYNIELIARTDRSGFKAGALENGLKQAKGEFVAIFDADFIPNPNFLVQTLPYLLEDEKVGLIQTKWEHINKEYSMLTKIQAFALDAHFVVEQAGRSSSGLFLNFNGTAGIWRTQCIEDAGGWSFDSLTEDLELSYRAQLKGWQLKYIEECGSPAELPVAMGAIKSQQYRWSKGPAEVARKMLGKVLLADIPLRTKRHSFFHLLNSSINFFVLYTAVLSVPLLYAKILNPQHWVFDLIFIFLVGLVAIGAFYLTAQLQIEKDRKKAFSNFAIVFPSFLSLSMGLSLHNSVGVIKGLMGVKSPFVRTPKHNIKSSTDLDKSWMKQKYLSKKIDLITIGEVLMAMYFLMGIVMAIQYGIYGLLPFHIMLFLGYLAISYFTLKHLWLSR